MQPAQRIRWPLVVLFGFGLGCSGRADNSAGSSGRESGSGGSRTESSGSNSINGGADPLGGSSGLSDAVTSGGATSGAATALLSGGSSGASSDAALGGSVAGGTSNGAGMRSTGGSIPFGGRTNGGAGGMGGDMRSGGASSGGGVVMGGAIAIGGRAAGGANATSGKTGGATSGGSTGVGGSARGGGATSGGSTGVGGSAPSGGATAECSSTTLSYDATILCEKPVAYWAMTKTTGTESDLTANANTATIRGGPLQTTTLPNGDPGVLFNGSNQYVTVPSRAAFSVPTTGSLTWEAWIEPTVLQFPNDGGSGYVDWMGKCADYSPTCEWESRMYSTTNSENRCNRLSAYIFNPSAGLGSAADWQPVCGLIQANHWYHVVGEYTTLHQPANCANTASYPGSIEIWVNAVQWNQARHGSTGCMSQYSVVPKIGSSPLNIGTMAQDGWFPGSIAKVAIYDYLLTAAQISRHYVRMTGTQPTGSCGNDCSF